jgi:Regulator of chromosome condensation (RCC1) repeat
VITPGVNVIGSLAVIPAQTYLGKALKLTAPKATSALPVTLSIKSGPATLSGGVTLTTTGAGTVTVAANQGGNANYAPASEVTTSFTVNKAAQKITLGKIAAQTNGMAPFTPVGSSSSGLQVTYSILSGPAVVSANKVALLGVGTVTLAANQSGNSNFLAAPQVSAAFAVVAPKAGKLPTNAVGNVADANTIPTIPVLPVLPLSIPTNAGSVVAWGDNTFGQTNLPAGLTNVVQISSRGVHTLALLANGTVKAWGLNQSGQAGVPSSLTNVVQVAAGTHHSLALINNGTVIGWGDDSFGQVAGALQITNAVQIAAGNDHSIALLADGTVAGWGWDAYGQASGGEGISNAVQVTAGYFHSAALLNDGTVQAWGDNTYSESTVPSGASNVVQLAAGLNHTVALKGDGSVLAWGWNNAGQTNVPVLSGGVCQIASGGNTVFAVTTNGTLITWGDNTYGQQKPPSTLSKVLQFVLGLYHAAALKK